MGVVLLAMLVALLWVRLVGSLVMVVAAAVAVVAVGWLLVLLVVVLLLLMAPLLLLPLVMMVLVGSAVGAAGVVGVGDVFWTRSVFPCQWPKEGVENVAMYMRGIQMSVDGP